MNYTIRTTDGVGRSWYRVQRGAWVLEKSSADYFSLEEAKALVHRMATAYGKPVTKYQIEGVKLPSIVSMGEENNV